MSEWITDRDPRPEELNAWQEAWVVNEDHHPHVGIWLGDDWAIQGLGWCASRKVIKWKPVTEEDIE